MTIKGHVSTCPSRSSPCSQGYLAVDLIRYTFCLFLHYRNLNPPLRYRLCALDCPSHGIFPHDDTIELRPIFSSTNIVPPVWPLEPILENWGYGGPKSQRKDTRQRWLFVAGLPVTAVGSIEQRVSIFLEPDSEQGTLCVTAMMFNICALSGGWVNVDGGHGSLPTW